jgi:hypothetical protein
MSEDKQTASVSFEPQAVLMEQKQPMTRTLGVERVFTLGNYKTIRFIDTIENIPEKLAFDAELVSKIRALQFITIEKDYRDYIATNKEVNAMSFEDAITALDEERATTLEDIKNILTEKEE